MGLRISSSPGAKGCPFQPSPHPPSSQHPQESRGPFRKFFTKELGAVAHARNLNTWEAEAGGLPTIQGQPGLIVHSKSAYL